MPAFHGYPVRAGGRAVAPEWPATAKQLHARPNTVRYRLRRWRSGRGGLGRIRDG
ncbi:helix-turn-helix domain-containing protein [Catenulispora subtropica]|uniref:helix-turn-helix domain-containing protein n=1 Tax=Catenulispora subtropica TaxID=450798 RepID=UPI003CD0B4EF